MGLFTIANILVAVLAYLLGSINISIILGKLQGIDIRTQGSGNAGTTNSLRVLGKRAAAITLTFDILKGVVAIVLSLLVSGITKAPDEVILKEIAGIFVIIGHMFPVFYAFKGGKGIATSLGVLLMIDYQIALICLVFALVIMIITRIVSLGSIAAAILLPILVLFINSTYFIFSLIIAAIVLIKHRENIKRLLNGTENKLGKKK